MSKSKKIDPKQRRRRAERLAAAGKKTKGKSGPLGSTIQGHCVDCGKPFLLREEYIVRNHVWAEAGMVGWDSGYLHRPCLEARLGRQLTKDDLFAWVVGETQEGVAMNAHKDYIAFEQARCAKK